MFLACLLFPLPHPLDGAEATVEERAVMLSGCVIIIITYVCCCSILNY